MLGLGRALKYCPETNPFNGFIPHQCNAKIWVQVQVQLKLQCENFHLIYVRQFVPLRTVPIQAVCEKAINMLSYRIF